MCFEKKGTDKCTVNPIIYNLTLNARVKVLILEAITVFTMVLFRLFRFFLCKVQGKNHISDTGEIFYRRSSAICAYKTIANVLTQHFKIT